MPVSYHREGRLFVLRCVGEYEIGELMGLFDEMLEAPDFPADAQVLLDIREAESVLHHSVGELREVANHFVARSSAFGDRCAILVKGIARYGLMRMASAWVEFAGIDAQVFREEEAALSWLLRQPVRVSEGDGAT